MVSEMIPNVFLQFSNMYSCEMVSSELAAVKSEYFPGGGGTWEAEAGALQSKFQGQPWPNRQTDRQIKSEYLKIFVLSNSQPRFNFHVKINKHICLSGHRCVFTFSKW